LLAVAYFEKQSGQIQLSHQKNSSHITSHPAVGLNGKRKCKCKWCLDIKHN